jgi:hypothetical protein
MAEEWPDHVLLEMYERRLGYRKPEVEVGRWLVEAIAI